ncbi:MAG: phage tail tip lysozyme [Propionibacteriaceae bacterium]
MSHSPTRSPLRRGLAAAAVLLASAGLVVAGPLLTASAEPVATETAPASGVNAIGMSPNVDAQVAIIRENEATAFAYFVEKGLSTEQAAGVIGNLDQESGMDPTIHQIGGGPGRGIAQWSAGGRWDTHAGDNVVEFAAGGDPYNLQVQLDFIWYELTEFSYYGLADLQAAGTVEEAVVAFQDAYEGCGTCHTDRRIAFALDAYGLYA